MPKFTGSIAATARVRCDHFEVEADNLQDAITKAKAEGIKLYTFGAPDDDDINGDAIAYIEKVDGQPVDGDQIEVYVGDDGEPFSWLACELVKDAAESDPDDHAAAADVIKRARGLCRREVLIITSQGREIAALDLAARIAAMKTRAEGYRRDDPKYAHSEDAEEYVSDLSGCRLCHIAGEMDSLIEQARALLAS